MKKWIFRISILCNVVFLAGYFFHLLNSPSGQLGQLTQNIEIGIFTSDSVVCKLPKGLTVRNVSERGLGAIGQFENERFAIVITSDNPALVNYNVPLDSLQPFGNYYSAEVHK